MVNSLSGISSYTNQINIQSMQQHREKMFNKVDNSGNGSVDQTEFDAFVVKLSEQSGTSINTEETFTTYDSDGDGTLNQDEMDSFMKENAPSPPSPPSSGMMNMLSPEEMFSDIDTDSDGGISQTELETFTAKMATNTGVSMNTEETFTTYDSDGDGTLNEDEMDSFMKDNAPSPPSSPSSGRMQEGISAYTSGINNTNSTTSLFTNLSIELLKQINSDSSAIGDTMDLQNQYTSQLIQSMSSYGNSQYTYSPINLKV
ncbi:MAG: EF-hand domain-containing protein [Desulfamplus sp.]|nr:EF-hand domain-containing protein [Desulfamplus sp.]